MSTASICDILYIEGNADDVVFFQRAFEKAAIPCAVHVVDTIPDAIRCLSAEPPDTDQAAFPIPDLIVTEPECALGSRPLGRVAQIALFEN